MFSTNFIYNHLSDINLSEKFSEMQLLRWIGVIRVIKQDNSKSQYFKKY